MATVDEGERAEALQRAIHRRLGGAGRLCLALDMSVAARTMTLARLRRRYPHFSEFELKKTMLRESFSPERLPPPLR